MRCTQDTCRTPLLSTGSPVRRGRVCKAVSPLAHHFPVLHFQQPEFMTTGIQACLHRDPKPNLPSLESPARARSASLHPWMEPLAILTPTHLVLAVTSHSKEEEEEKKKKPNPLISGSERPWKSLLFCKCFLYQSQIPEPM